MDSRSEQMLELLSQGASARVVAKKLGYSEGTMRVYLHNLYRLIGVRNKTEAVIWQMNRTRAADLRAVSASVPPPEYQSAAGPGEMALAEDLYTALGVMSSFLGPYGHVWEAGLRLKGTALDEKTLIRRAQSRLLWRALLKGDFAYAKTLYDDGVATRLLSDAPSDALLVACLLVLGGYSGAAEKVIGRLTGKRKPMAGISAREAALLSAVRDAVESASEEDVAALYELAAEGNRSPVLQQIAMAALFHVYKGRRESERASAVADAMWSESEAARQQLEAMGVRPLQREASLPRLAKSGTREPVLVREKAAAR